MMTLQSPLLFALVSITTPAFGGDLHLDVPSGMQVELWAESPLFYNPTAMDVDERGRLWVTEAVNYRKWGGRNPGRDHEGGDRLVILSDTDGDGVCETSKVFAQGPELVSPLGVCVLGEGRVLVSCSPSALLYIDDDGDDQADRHEVFLTGFGGPNHDHGLHSFVHGPDGEFYFAAGNAGPHLVTDAAGWQLRSGSVYVGGGEFTADNKPGLVSDDGRAWTGGLTLRVGKDGRGLGVMSHNFRNNYELALDSFGNMYVADNDDDGNRGCRTLWAMQGGNYGYFSEDGTRYWRADRRPGQSIPSAHWHQEDPGVFPAGAINGAGGPTGVCVYEGEPLKAWIDGAVLNADAGAGVVYAHKPKQIGAGYGMEAGWLIRGDKSEERSAQWFRPSDVCVGTDGSVFVADWYDPGVGGHAAGDREAYGRILRITPEGSAIPPRSIEFGKLEGALEAFASPAPSVRAMGAKRLFDAKGKNFELVAEMAAKSSDAREKARLIYGLKGMGFNGLARTASFLSDPDPRLRVVALRALMTTQMGGFDILQPRCEDPSPLVRREVMTHLNAYADNDKYMGVMLRLAEGYDGEDRNYLEAFGLAARGHEEQVFVGLSLHLGNSPSRWTSAFADLAWRLHPDSAVNAFKARAGDVTLDVEQRKQAVESLAFIPSRSAAEAVTNLALIAGGEVGELATWWVRNRVTNDWSEYGLGVDLVAGDLGAAELVWESGVMRAGRRLAKVDVKGAKRIWLTVGDAGDGNTCDWADWIEPRFLTADGELPLTELSWSSAEAGWGNVNVNRNAVGQTLSCGDEPIRWGIGTHANSKVEYKVPAGALTFECSVGPDFGGTGQGGATSIEFRIYVERERDRTQLLEHLAAIQDASRSSNEREDATRALASDPEGGLILIAQARANRLLEDVRETAREAIFNNPDIAVRALASEVFRRTENAPSLPPIPELLQLEGDARRGQQIFQSEAAACNTCHSFAGLGMDIGPDLTAIGVKYGRAELMDAILNPSAAIAFGYDSWLMQVKGKGYFTGFILADGPNVVLKDPKGARHVFAAADILERDRQRVSVMPQGVALGLGAQGLADLVSFLLENREAKPILGEPVVLFDGTDLEDWNYHLDQADASMEDVWSLEEGGVLRCKGRPIGYLSSKQSFTNFELELEWRFDPAKGAGNSGVLLRMTGPDTVWPRSIEAQLHSRNAGDIWNIGEFPMMTDKTRRSGRRTTKLAPSNEKPLGEWNHYLITMDRGVLSLVINGTLQNEATWCEEISGKICLQSEGAEIQFRNIVVRPIVGHE